jgi:glutathione-regulated potassium-efflux system ancillary protein KefG
MSKPLILFAHPSQSRSEINMPLFNASKIEGVTLVDLYNEYPNYRINIEREQNRLIEHDVIIFMFPLYWYSTPAILKEWQDLVLEYGFAYGHDGKALDGKKFFCVTTAGGPEDAYQSEGMNHYSINELLQPLEQMARLCNMQYLPPFVLFGARTAQQENRVELHIKQWETILKNIVHNQFDYCLANKNRLLNHINNVEIDS